MKITLIVSGWEQEPSTLSEPPFSWIVESSSVLPPDLNTSSYKICEYNLLYTK